MIIAAALFIFTGKFRDLKRNLPFSRRHLSRKFEPCLAHSIPAKWTKVQLHQPIQNHMLWSLAVQAVSLKRPRIQAQSFRPQIASWRIAP
jgi:hypothetical protein